MTEIPVTRDKSRDKVKQLLHILKDDIKTKGLSTAKKRETLDSLKSHIISAEVASLFTQDDVKTLCVFALEEPDENRESSLVALKCLANLLLLEPKSRQYLVNEGYAPAVAKRLRGSLEDELLCSRILFLLTYETTFNFEDLFNNASLASSIQENIIAHTSHYVRSKDEQHQNGQSKNGGQQAAPRPAAIVETLKLLFNLNQFYPNHVQDFSPVIAPILEILRTIEVQVSVLQQPVTALINSLLSLDLPGSMSSESQESKEVSALFPQPAHLNCLCLINILDASIQSSKEDDLDSLVPLLTLLRRVYELAPTTAKEYMQEQLLPSSTERAQPLGKTNSLPSRLLRLSTAPTSPRLKEGVSSFLFELSDKDAGIFVRNVGYGFAAGYLMTHNLPIPHNVSGDTHESVITVDGQEINPITGQRRDMEPEDPLPAMTDEEKEREAERLFVLFERLRATGVMNVVNPVEQAINEGRFEEVDEEKSDKDVD
ncbi:hypothetical protein ACLMJK_006042 [Lecanora helva]